MKSILKLLCLVLISIYMMVLGGCGSSSGGGSGGGGSNGGASNGTLSLNITDAPVDNASQVVVEFTGIEIQSSSGDRTEFNYATPKHIDLLALQGGRSEVILDNEVLPSGDYEWIRLKVNAVCNVIDSYIVFNGSTEKHSIQVPSGSQSGLKLVRGFNLAADGVADFTIDFDLRNPVNTPNGKGKCSCDYKLKPALRMVNNTEAGSISGTVHPTLINDPACTDGNVVYVFDGLNAVPDDIDLIAPDPVTSAMVTTDVNGDYVYRASFLSPGDYTVAFTCQADDDDPEEDDVISFLEQANAVVTAGQVTTHNF